MSALHRFVGSNHDIEELRHLLTGENPNSKDRLERTPLYIAVMRCEMNPQLTDEILLVILELISFGANVDLGDDVDITPLHLAVICKNYKIIKALLEANADVDKKDYRGWAALHYATRRSHGPKLAVVKLLLKYNPDINIQTKMNETPLMFSSQTDNLNIILELLKNDSSVTIQDNWGDTVMHYAMKQPVVNAKVVFEFSRYGCSFDTNNCDDLTPRECYLDRLDSFQTRAEKNCAKQLIKLFILDGYQFKQSELNSIHRFHQKNKKYKLYRFLSLCNNEIEEMHGDELAPNCTVYDIAYRGAFSRDDEIDDRFTAEAFDAVLSKIIKRQFPKYFDVILSGICNSSINLKFAGICCNTVSGVKIFEYDSLFLLANYLKKIDKLNMMFACFRDV